MPKLTLRLWGIFAVAFVVGICSGLFGVGGGVLLVPLLVLVFAFDQHQAQGTSLVALVPPTGLLAFLTYYRAHEVDVKVGLLIIPGIFLGGILGSKIATSLSPRRMRITFAIFLFLLGGWQVFSAWTK
ncbi:MAG TPA: sulfite exporter TauE/SafE family protein [Candidatus Acidoferrum sp.]|nr:sulfite exporter TauE/SafE family protein [Candidatus Acidoferrum sp.]